jgi:hypothetical protein
MKRRRRHQRMKTNRRTHDEITMLLGRSNQGKRGAALVRIAS